MYLRLTGCPYRLQLFQPMSAPKPVNKPPSEKPITESADAPMATPPATPKSNIEFLTIGLPKPPNDDPKLQLATGAQKALNRIIS